MLLRLVGFGHFDGLGEGWRRLGARAGGFRRVGDANRRRTPLPSPLDSMTQLQRMAGCREPREIEHDGASLSRCRDRQPSVAGSGAAAPRPSRRAPRLRARRRGPTPHRAVLDHSGDRPDLRRVGPRLLGVRVAPELTEIDGIRMVDRRPAAASRRVVRCRTTPPTRRPRDGHRGLVLAPARWPGRSRRPTGRLELLMLASASGARPASR